MSRGVFEVSIDGTPFRVVQERYQRRFLDVVRQQADSQQEPSEFSLNPSDLWRRAQTSWRHGAGQTTFDVNDSDRMRFREGLNVDPFEVRGQVQMAHSVDSMWEASDATLSPLKVVTDGTSLFVLMDPSESPSTAIVKLEESGLATDFDIIAPENKPVDIVAVNDRVFIARSANGIAELDTSDGTSTTVNDLVAERIAFVRGRLIASAGPNLYNILDLTDRTIPDSLTPGFIDPNVQWTAIGETLSFILVAARMGDRSLIYRITIREDGTSLTSPVASCEMPTDEHVRAIKSYLGVVVLATNRGVRIGVMQQGELQYGPLVYEGDDVWDLEAKDRFVWFTMQGQVGRLDLSEFLEEFELVPAWSPDVNLPTAADVVHIGRTPWSGELVLFTRGGASDASAWCVEKDRWSTTPAYFTTGRITYGMADEKNFRFVDVVADLPHPADTVQVLVSDEYGTQFFVGMLERSRRGTFTIDLRGEWVELQFLLGNGSAGESTPALERWTLRSLPVPSRTEQVEVPLDLRATVLQSNEMVHRQDVAELYRELQALVTSGRTVRYREFDLEYLATVENLQFGPDLDVDRDFDYWEGLATVVIRLYGRVDEFQIGGREDLTAQGFNFGLYNQGLFNDRSYVGGFAPTLGQPSTGEDES